MDNASPIILRKILVFPLKGAGGIELDETVLDAFGIPGDRRWMLARPDGEFISQRTHPRLTLIRTTPDTPRQGASTGHGRQDSSEPLSTCPRFSVEAPGSGTLSLSPTGTDQWLEVKLHDDRFEAQVGFDEADRWFSDFLGEACRLVFIPDDVIRPVDPAWAPGHRVGLADGYPLHLTTEESLADLNARLSQSTTMLRYRPNLVLSGGAPWEEDEWRVLDVGGTRVDLVKPCARCAVVTVDPVSAARGKEPLRSMAAFREWDGKVFFGQNAVVPGSDGEPGRFRVGANVRILERGPRRPPLPVTSNESASGGQ